MPNDIPHLPTRTVKPRSTGVTSISDVGLPMSYLKGLLQSYGVYIDIAKLGVGTAWVEPDLDSKIELYRQHDIAVYFGGTLFEKFQSSDALDEYKAYLRAHSIDIVEVSDGSLVIDLDQRLAIIRELVDEFTVFAEIGSKDREKIMAPSQWIDEIQGCLDAGCRYVITEGRDTGTAGIYRPSGELRTGLVTDIISRFRADQIIFEAPEQKAQMWFINEVGSNVNLGNVRPDDSLILEAQRLGLRYETFSLQ